MVITDRRVIGGTTPNSTLLLFLFNLFKMVICKHIIMTDIAGSTEQLLLNFDVKPQCFHCCRLNQITAQRMLAINHYRPVCTEEFFGFFFILTGNPVH